VYQILGSKPLPTARETSPFPTARAGPVPVVEGVPVSGDQRALLRRLRTLAGLSVREFAHEAGMSPSFVSAVETGRKSPSARFEQATLDVLQRHGVFQAILFGRSD